MKPNGVVKIGSPDTFNQLVKKYENHLIVTTFSSPTCGACRQFKPIFEQVEKQFTQKPVLFTEVDVMQLPEVAQQFNIMATPTTLFIINHKIKKSQPGALPVGMLQNLVNENLGKL